MLTSVRSLAAASFLAGCAVFATPAAAQDTGDISVSANVALVSQYRFRGVDLSGGDFAIQGGVDVSHSSGLYVGTWGSSLDEDTVGFGHTELNIYGGYTADINETLSFDVGVLAYLYPNAGPGDFDLIEVYGSVGFGFGPADLAVGLAYAPKQDSIGGTDNIYIYADASFGIPNTPVSLGAHIGYTDGGLALTNNSQAWDWSLGADLAINQNLSLGVAYVGAEGDYLPGDYNYTRDAVVFSLSASF